MEKPISPAGFITLYVDGSGVELPESRIAFTALKDGDSVSAGTLDELRDMHAALTAEQRHAAFDLAQYTVNTSALYAKAQEIMRHRAAGQFSNNLWIGHAKLGRQSYESEMGADDHTQLFFIPSVVTEAARQIMEHYAEEQAEIAAANQPES